MSKTLISWIATKNDLSGNHINFAGPTYRFHQNFFDGYEKHILLTTEKDTLEISPSKLFYSSMVKEFPNHNIKLHFVDIAESDVINFNRIHAAIYPFLLSLRDTEIDIFVSPGTPTMQVVWYVIHMEMQLKTRLLQTVKPEDSTTKEPELIEITLNQSRRAEFFILNESNRSDAEQDYCPTDSQKSIDALINEIALTNKTTVLIQGETGTGKEYIAKEIHTRSVRKSFPYKSVNCAALNSELLESRLFGYEKGAFTGALKKTDGYFHAANGGTIFLDEIGDISPQMQVVLLRILQEGELQRVGSPTTEFIDVRVVAATNKNLFEECKKGTFRWDLYYRLCVAEISTQPLRERGAKEIKELLNFFNNKFYRTIGGTKKKVIFTPSIIKLLCDYEWPGNVRELANLVERCYAYGLETVTRDNLPVTIISLQGIESKKLKNVLRLHVQKIVNMSNGNLSKAAKILGLGSVNTVKKYLS